MSIVPRCLRCFHIFLETATSNFCRQVQDLTGLDIALPMWLRMANRPPQLTIDPHQLNPTLVFRCVIAPLKSCTIGMKTLSVSPIRTIQEPAEILESKLRQSSQSPPPHHNLPCSTCTSPPSRPVSIFLFAAGRRS